MIGAVGLNVDNRAPYYLRATLVGDLYVVGTCHRSDDSVQHRTITERLLYVFMCFRMAAPLFLFCFVGVLLTVRRLLVGRSANQRVTLVCCRVRWGAFK